MVIEEVDGRQSTVDRTEGRWAVHLDFRTVLPDPVSMEASMAPRSEPALSLPAGSRCLRAGPIAAFALCLAPALAAGDAPDAGERIYRQRCASCHGDSGQGAKGHPDPLAGELSVPELVRTIEESMPEDKPGTCTGKEAQEVARFIFDAFYSPAAQARRRGVRAEASRLTV